MNQQSRINTLSKCLFLAMIALLLCSCMPTTKYNVAKDQIRPAFSGKVLVFNKTIPDNIQYSVMGDFVAQSEWYGGTDETANSATKEAAAKGANGILIEAQGHRMAGFSYASPYTEGKLLWIENYEVAQKKI